VEMVHGRQSRERAERTTEVLFCGGDWRSLAAGDLEQAFAASPRSSLPRSALGTNDASLVSILTDAGLTPSRGQARQGLATGGFSLNDEVVKDALRSLGEVDFLGGRFAVLRRGKKSWHVVELV
jgi:tyrosyl-tRNA synthetase